ncbi:MAG: hypothetical protein U0822_10830 [Anaerolineae bacterium]
MNELWPWLTLALLGAYHGLNPGMGWLFAVGLGLQERSRRAVLRAFFPIALGHAVSVAAVVALVAMAEAFVAPSVLRNVGGVALIGFGLYKLVAPMSHPRWVGMRVSFRDLVVWSFLMATAHGAGFMLAPVLLHMTPTTLPQAAYAAPPAAIVSVAQTTAAEDGSYCPPLRDLGQAASATDHTDYAHHGMDHGTSQAVYQEAGEPGQTVALSAGGHMDHMAHAGELSAVGTPLPFAEAWAVGVHTLAMFGVMAVVAVVVFEKLGLAILRRAWFNLDRMWAVALIGAGVLTFLV